MPDAYAEAVDPLWLPARKLKWVRPTVTAYVPAESYVWSDVAGWHVPVDAAVVSPRGGDIGDNPREVEFEPLTAPNVPEPIHAPTPAEPVRTPEEVPA